MTHKEGVLAIVRRQMACWNACMVFMSDGLAIGTLEKRFRRPDDRLQYEFVDNSIRLETYTSDFRRGLRMCRRLLCC